MAENGVVQEGPVAAPAVEQVVLKEPVAEGPAAEPREALLASIEGYVAVEVTARMNRRAQELFQQVMALVAGVDGVVVVAVLEAVKHKAIEAMLRPSQGA